MERINDVVYITGWNSEAEFLKSKNSNLPTGIKKYYVEDFEELMHKYNLKLTGIKVLKEGTVLVKNPFLKNTYVDFEDAEILFVHAKAQCISEILQNLGAKSFVTKAHDKFKEKESRTLDVDVKHKNTKNEERGANYKSVKGKYQKKDWNFEREDIFSGTYSQQTYERAKEIAEETGLIHDVHISGLIDQRNPLNENPINSNKISIEMTSEFNKIRDIVFGFKGTKLTLNLKYQKILKTYHLATRDIEINFGE